MKEFYSNSFISDWFGTITGTASVQPFPSGTARLARFKANPANMGDVFIGNAGEVIFPLDAGQDTGWFSPTQGKLENYQYLINAGVTGTVHFWAQR